MMLVKGVSEEARLVPHPGLQQEKLVDYPEKPSPSIDHKPCRQRHVNKRQVLERALQRMRRNELSRCFFLWRDRFGEVDDYARKRKKVQGLLLTDLRFGAMVCLLCRLVLL